MGNAFPIQFERRLFQDRSEEGRQKERHGRRDPIAVLPVEDLQMGLHPFGEAAFVSKPAAQIREKAR